MERYLCGAALCLLLGAGLLQTNAFEVEVKEGSDTCIFATINVNFTITYENVNGSMSNVTFTAPEKVTTEGSNCSVPLLNVNFGSGHSWILNFTKNDTVYSSVLTFTYDTSDTKLFPDAKTKGPVTSVIPTSFFSPIPLNASYKCLHSDVVESENLVQLYWNVTLQAYVQNSTLGKAIPCSADLPTTAAPTTAKPTTAPITTAPTTHNATTAAPSTTSPPKPTPPPVEKPAVGNYSVLDGNKTCLLASMGLQLNISTQIGGKEVWNPVNINPNVTVGSGSCGNESALLRLNDGSSTIIEFTFILADKKFHLEGVNVTLTNGSGISHLVNSNLSLWEAADGNSYLCHREQHIKVSEGLLLNTFDVRVQPFKVQNATFATAQDCLADENFTVPIVVGAALAGLIILVVVAYFIGRRKQRTAGYEQFQ